MERPDIPLQEITIDSKTIYLLGTAHVSEESVNDVLYAIETIQPDTVAVELDEAREKRLTKQDQSWRNMDMFKVIKEKKALFLLSSIVLSSFQRRLGENLSVAPGEEMLTAINKSKELGIPIVLADRSAEITLKRAWNKSSFWGRQKIIATLVGIVFTKETISEEELTELKQKSTQGQMLEELSEFLPQMKEILLDERDEYLATNILNAEGNKILAVLGAAHVPGIMRRIQAINEEKARNAIANEKSLSFDGDAMIATTAETSRPETANTETSRPETSRPEPTAEETQVHSAQPTHAEVQARYKARLDELNIIPQKKKFNPLSFIVPLAVLGLFAYGFVRGGAGTLAENFFWWWIINGGLSLLGAIISLAHPVTILVSFFAAPLTSLNPFIGVGFVTGLCETFFRKPRVKDFEEIQTLSLSPKALYKNRVTHILLVFVATSIGSIIGTFSGISILATNV